VQTGAVLEIVVIVAAGLVLGLVAFALVGLVRVRSLRSRHRRRLATVDPRHSEPASLVGLASEGRLQTRGVGTLALGDTHLLFAQLLPERDVLVPRDAITSTRATRHFLGRTTGADLLLVTWEVDGLADAAAFAVPDVDAWRDRLA
jgi:HAMP domain-containing protein